MNVTSIVRSNRIAKLERWVKIFKPIMLITIVLSFFVKYAGWTWVIFPEAGNIPPMSFFHWSVLFTNADGNGGGLIYYLPGVMVILGLLESFSSTEKTKRIGTGLALVGTLVYGIMIAVLKSTYIENNLRFEYWYSARGGISIHASQMTFAPGISWVISLITTGLAGIIEVMQYQQIQDFIHQKKTAHSTIVTTQTITPQINTSGSTTVSQRHCPKCKEIVDSDFRACPNCGKNFR